MSDLYAATEVLNLAKEIVGKKGPIHIDTRVYAHNIFLKEDRSNEDSVVLGADQTEVTVAQLVDLFEQLNSLVDALSDETDRTYFFEGFTKHAADKFSLNWGS